MSKSDEEIGRAVMKRLRAINERRQLASRARLGDIELILASWQNEKRQPSASQVLQRMPPPRPSLRSVQRFLAQIRRRQLS